MKKRFIPAVITAYALIAFTSACSKAPVGGALVSHPELHGEATSIPEVTVAPTAEIQPISPPDRVDAEFNSYSELAAAITDSKSSAYGELHGEAYRGRELDALGERYISFIDKLESHKLIFPVPQFDGEAAKLNPGIYDQNIYFISEDLFSLPSIWYRVEHNGVKATIEVLPLSIVKELKLTGSETYSDISKKLNPNYPTENTPNEQYSEYYSKITAHELELANGRNVWATVFVEIESSYDGAVRTTYAFVYDDFLVSTWKWVTPDDPEELTDEFFKSFSLGGDLMKAGD